LPLRNRRAPRVRRRPGHRSGDGVSRVLVGYIWIKTDDDDALRAQRRALQDAGCERVVEDLASGGRWDQPELRRMLDELRPGDVVVVAQLGCLGRSLQDVVRLVQRIGTAGAGLRSLAEAIDTTTPAGQAAAQLIGGLAAFGHRVARDRIGTGLAAARAEGRVGGRRPKLTARLRATIADEVLSGRRSAAHMARLHKVSEATVSRLLAAHRTGAAVPGTGGQESGDANGSDRIAGVLPLSALNGRLAIVGTSGSGKPNTAICHIGGSADLCGDGH